MSFVSEGFCSVQLSGSYLRSCTEYLTRRRFCRKPVLRFFMYNKLFLLGLRCIVMLSISYFLSALVHEFGHLLGAAKHGGFLLVLRVGRLIFPGGKNRPWLWKGRKVSVSPGCCVVLCSGREGYIEAAAGGSRANLYLSMASVCGSLFLSAAKIPMNQNIFLLQGLLAAVSLFISLVNFLPIEGSDEAVKRRLKKDEGYAEKFRIQQEKCLVLLENGLWEEVCLD